MSPHTVHTRLVALLVGVAIAAAAACCTFLLLPAQSEQATGVEYGYVYSGAKSSSASFIEANMDQSSILVQGSSEFSTPSSLVPQVPSQVFGATNYGLRMMCVGEAYDQSLWHTMALGALANGNRLPGGKVVLIVAPGWFVDGGQDPNTFKTRFSYSMWQGFCDNPDVPDQTKSYVASRLRQMGIDETTINSGAGNLPQDRLDSLALGALDDLKLRQQLGKVRQEGSPLASGELQTPDWESLRAQALADAQARSTNNDWGIENGFYADRLAPVLDGSRGIRAGETYSATPEYDDLRAYLQVAKANGLDVLVIVSPVCGPYYDHIGIDASARATCYERIRQVAADEGAQVADFSDREYERYFLYDIVHFGWTGWIDVEQSIYQFAQGGE